MALKSTKSKTICSARDQAKGGLNFRTLMWAAATSEVAKYSFIVPDCMFRERRTG